MAEQSTLPNNFRPAPKKLVRLDRVRRGPIAFATRRLATQQRCYHHPKEPDHSIAGWLIQRAGKEPAPRGIPWMGLFCASTRSPATGCVVSAAGPGTGADHLELSEDLFGFAQGLEGLGQGPGDRALMPSLQINVDDR